ncbi:MAG TPA: S8 family serine peptidase [Bryobacteraceae bacterium]|nr:S8 family serine peptidase [Bryobacteraceae bacterium]
MRLRSVLLLAMLATLPLFAERYALLLEDAPAPAAETAARTRILAAQSTVRRELARRAVPVTGAVERILNAVFVEAPPDRVDELRALPGVRAVAPMRRRKLLLDRAAELVSAPAAWAALGGTGNAGAGVKIAIIDTGIEQTHPAFQDPSIQPPAGFPKCNGNDCRFTNGKVIVARSYVSQLARGSGPDPAVNSRPDDLSPRDRVGHGTALAMIAAGQTVTGPAATVTGIAPKAWLGNYKIFGSPGINNGTSSDLIIQALEQALNDGMDVAVLSLGGPALSGPLDTGAACGAPAGTPCDPEAIAIENVIRAGLTVVAAAGNEGDLGEEFPALSSISAPGTAPSVIAAAASTNGHIFVNTLLVPGGDVPESLRRIPAVFGDGPVPQAPLTAPLRDVAGLGGDDGTACLGLPVGSLDGAFALIRRGGCTFVNKLRNAQQAGAVGGVFFQDTADTPLFTPGGLASINIPAVLVAFSAGTALRDFLAGNPNHLITLDRGLTPTPSSTFDRVAFFSSRGPNIGNADLKPDISAPGTDIYMAAQTFDPEGDLYDPTGFTVADGTSFSTPIVAGGVALVKQRNPGFTPVRLRSAVINNATPDITDENGERAGVVEAGAGILNVAAAVNTTATVEPATLSFGVIKEGTLPLTRQLTILNNGAAAAIMSLTVEPRTTDAQARVTLDRNSLTLAPGQSGAVTVTLQGARPLAGSYDGAVLIGGGATPLRVPYSYVVGDGVPFNIFPLYGFDFRGTVNEDNPDGGIAFRVVDRYGVSVPNVPVTFRVTRGGGRVELPDTSTDAYGIAGAAAVLGPLAGPQQFVGTAGSLTVTFDGSARAKPTISTGGVVNAASFAADQPVAPGSWISLFGTGLSDVTRVAQTAALPISLTGVNVSFDAGSVSVPGNVWYISPRQVNLQVPWELAGQSSARLKVNINNTTGRLATVPLATYSPAVFAATTARRGQNVEVYANGLGPVDRQLASGEPAPAQTLVRTLATPTVTIGARSAPVTFSGLAPGYVGLYQLNVTVPADVPAGPHPLVITIGGRSSPSFTLTVQ